MTLMTVHRAFVPLVITVATILIASACGSDGEPVEVTQRSGTALTVEQPTQQQQATGAVDPTKPASPFCASSVSTPKLSELGDLVAHSPFADSIDKFPIRTLDEARRSGGNLAVGKILEVRDVDLEPLGLLPDGGSTFAGNTALWSGLQIDIEFGNGKATIDVPLIAGSADVIAAVNANVTAADFKPVIGACAVVYDAGDNPSILGQVRLIAVAPDDTSHIAVFDDQFAALIDSAQSLRAISG